MHVPNLPLEVRKIRDQRESNRRPDAPPWKMPPGKGAYVMSQDGFDLFGAQGLKQEVKVIRHQNAAQSVLKRSLKPGPKLDAGLSFVKRVNTPVGSCREMEVVHERALQQGADLPSPLKMEIRVAIRTHRPKTGLAAFRQKHPACSSHAPSFCRFSAKLGVASRTYAHKSHPPHLTRRTCVPIFTASNREQKAQPCNN